MIYYLLSLILLCSSCTHKTQAPPISTIHTPGQVPLEPLTKINVIDQNGISETIVQPERVKQFASVPLLAPQSYKKLLRIYKKDSQGNTKSILTSYYDNGQLHQYLECINSRACGPYCEWYEDGKKKLESYVVAGIGDLNPQAVESFSFQGLAQAWNDKGALFASCQYEVGKLSGTSYTYHPNGTPASKSLWKSGLQYGLALSYSPDGKVIESTSYENGKREGKAEGYHENQTLAFEEWYEQDLLITAKYFLPTGEEVSSITKGWGNRTIFRKGKITTQHEVENGKPEGKVSLFDSHGHLERTYYVRSDKRHGTETWYFPESNQKQRSIQWVDDEIHGIVQTWYTNGIMESSREFCHNQKHGMSTSWYKDGSTMLVEEYQFDKLIRGRYHKKGFSEPISQVDHSSGVVTLFDGDGNLIETVTYRDSVPEIKD